MAIEKSIAPSTRRRCPTGCSTSSGRTAARRSASIRGDPSTSDRWSPLRPAARGLFDFVLLDAAPILPVAAAVLMQDLVDGFLLVVRSRQTPRDAIHDALAKLRPERVIGVVLNDHREYRRTYKDDAYNTGKESGTRALPIVSGVA